MELRVLFLLVGEAVVFVMVERSRLAAELAAEAMCLWDFVLFACL